jgi:hypothetical protein
MASKSEEPRPDGSSPRLEEKASYFLGLELKNYRCFGEDAQKLDLSDGSGRPARWNILLGENGVGKTTVLEAAILSDFLIRSLRRIQYHNPLQLPDYLAHHRDRKIVDAYNILPHEYKFNVIRIGAHHVEIAPTVGTGSPLGIKSDKCTYEDFHGILSMTINSTLLSYNLVRLTEFPLCFSYGAGRRSGRSSLGDDRESKASAGLVFDDTELIDAEEWLLLLDYSASKDTGSVGKPLQRLKQVKALMVEILPEVDDIRFTIRGDVIPKASVEFRTPFGWVPIRGLGFGYRTLIAWMVDLVARLVERYPDSENPLAEPAVVLVDEIDLHLHPAWQRKLIGDLTRLFPNTQFIVTAHSPLIVQAAGEDANIALLRREGDHVVIENDLDFIKGWRVDQILTSDLFGLPTARPPQLDEPLARRKELLSKGKLTKKDKEELERLESKIGVLPAGETAAEARRLDGLIEETERMLKKHRPRKS